MKKGRFVIWQMAQVYIKNINITGNTRTQDYVIRRVNVVEEMLFY